MSNYVKADEYIRQIVERLLTEREDDFVAKIKETLVMPMPSAEWKDNFPDGYKCSECGASVKSAVISNYSWNITGKMKFCPNCGAEMKADDYCSRGERKD